MYTILMLNQKGGVGKTTIADELSFALERRGKTVAFVTTDPQGGSVHEVCDDPDFAEECDFQVVDTAGVLVGGVNDWCRAANLILVPMLLKDKPVVCLECEERFASIGDAAAKLHLNARKLGNAIRENEPYHGLHFFLIAESWQDETK